MESNNNINLKFTKFMKTKVQEVVFDDYVLINDVKVKSIFIDSNDICLLLKQCLKYEISFQTKDTKKEGHIYKDAITMIKPSFNLTIMGAKCVLQTGCSNYNTFEIMDYGMPCFNYIGMTENGYLVTIKDGYQYTYNSIKKILKIK